MNLVLGGKYNWKNQPERLVYLGKKGLWHQFAKIEYPGGVWCEVLDEDLHMLEETMDIRTPQDIVQSLIKNGWQVRFFTALGVFEWRSPRGVSGPGYKSKELYHLTVEVFADANKHGELS